MRPRSAGAPLPGPAGVEDRDPVFTTADFERVRTLIHRHAGIALGQSKHQMVYSRLARRVAASGLGSFAAYLDQLERGPGPEWEPFTNALTTNLTSFFREAHHFPVLVEHLRSLQRDRPLRIWSCAASTGEEAYSIAIAAAEAFRTPRPPVRILGTDLDTRVLAIAQAGVYDTQRVAGLSAQRVREGFLRGTGPFAGKVRVRPDLVSLVRFRQLNLVSDAWRALPPFDAIFCRNVMIYFDPPTQRALLARLAGVLAADGLLFAGHSESLLSTPDLFRLRGRTVYERAPVEGADAGHRSAP